MDPEIQRKLREYDRPTYGYRRGESGAIEKNVFDGTLPDGWVDSPARVDEAPEIPIPAEPGEEDSGEADEGMALSPPYDAHPFSKLRAETKRRTGKGPAPDMTKDEVVALLNSLDARAQAPE